jgi:hypothetical protein
MAKKPIPKLVLSSQKYKALKAKLGDGKVIGDGIYKKLCAGRVAGLYTRSHIRSDNSALYLYGENLDSLKSLPLKGKGYTKAIKDEMKKVIGLMVLEIKGPCVYIPVICGRGLGKQMLMDAVRYAKLKNKACIQLDSVPEPFHRYRTAYRFKLNGKNLNDIQKEINAALKNNKNLMTKKSSIRK